MRPWNDSHLGKKGTAHGGSMHEPNNNHVSAEHIKMLKKLQCLFEELKKDFAVQAEVISNFDKKLSISTDFCNVTRFQGDFWGTFRYFLFCFN
jgi:hypothetical protein